MTCLLPGFSKYHAAMGDKGAQRPAALPDPRVSGWPSQAPKQQSAAPQSTDSFAKTDKP